jgi:protocatechuate 3,4-dioxygenase beta subunit
MQQVARREHGRVPNEHTPPPFSRREVLGMTGVLALGLAAGCSGGGERDGSASGSTATTSGDGRASRSDAGPSDALSAADFDALSTCVLLPEQMAGPFPLDEQFDRRDITEGLPGHPMRLGLRVVDDTCTPVAGAAVEIWHTDASGDYSAFADGGGGKDQAEGTTFLRGTQTSGDDGIVEFLTIYPGWYTGRAVHIHVRVHMDDATVLTSQMYFDEDYTQQVLASTEYRRFGPPDTTWADDTIAGNPRADGTMLITTPAETAGGPGTLALLNLGVRRRGSS